MIKVKLKDRQTNEFVAEAEADTLYQAILNLKDKYCNLGDVKFPYTDAAFSNIIEGDDTFYSIAIIE